MEDEKEQLSGYDKAGGTNYVAIGIDGIFSEEYTIYAMGYDR